MTITVSCVTKDGKTCLQLVAANATKMPDRTSSVSDETLIDKSRITKEKLCDYINSIINDDDVSQTEYNTCTDYVWNLELDDTIEAKVSGHHIDFNDA